MFEAGASPGHQLAAYEDLRNRPVARHSLHHVHHHVPLGPGLVHLVALELSPEVVQGVLDKWEDLLNTSAGRIGLTLATVQYEQYVAEKIMTLFLMTRFLKLSADFLTSSLNLSSRPSALTASVLTGLFWAEDGFDSRIPMIWMIKRFLLICIFNKSQ